MGYSLYTGSALWAKVLEFSAHRTFISFSPLTNDLFIFISVFISYICIDVLIYLPEIIFFLLYTFLSGLKKFRAHITRIGLAFRPLSFFDILPFLRLRF